ncbi:unnamed protein product [Rotaria sp. Silwood2]|nr:unnamed protein product [Rotaria sp. Silwood2]
MINSTNNNNLHHHDRRNRWTKTTTKGQQLQSPSLILKNQYDQQQQEEMPMKNPLAWTKKWTKWFSSCGSERISHNNSNSRTQFIEVSRYLFIFSAFTTCCVIN